jgi:hypothetical protein
MSFETHTLQRARSAPAQVEPTSPTSGGLIECGTRDLKTLRRRCHFRTAVPPSSDDNHRVVSFPSAKARKTAFWREPSNHEDPSLLLSIAKFERDDREDDYRHRMIMNALALIVVVILIVIGVWLMTNIIDQYHTRFHTF